MTDHRSTGIYLLLAFTITQGIRDVYLSSAFASIGFFDMVALAFTLASVMFAGLVALRERRQLGLLRAQWRGVVAVNVTTATAWLCYFGALKLVEPSAVNLVFAGIAPLAVVLLAAIGLYSADRARATRFERVLHAATGATLLLLAWVVLTGRSGIAGLSAAEALGGLLLAAASGIIITAETVYAKRMNEAGVSATAILSVRFVLIALVAVFATAGLGLTDLPAMPAPDLLNVLVRLLLLVVAPLYLVQQGLALTSPLTAGIVSAFAPALVFMLQAMEGRIPPSGWVLATTLLYSALTLLGLIVRALSGRVPAARAATGAARG